MKSLWYPLAVDFYLSEMLAFEDDMVHIAFVKLIGYVKTQAPKKGQIKYRSPAILAKAIGMVNPTSPEACARLIEVASQGEEPFLRIEGDVLTVINWHEWHSPGALRVAEHRSKKTKEPGSPPQEPVTSRESEFVTPEPAKSVTNPLCNAQTQFVTENGVQKGFVTLPYHAKTETETDKEKPVVVERGVGERSATAPARASPTHPSPQQVQAYGSEIELPPGECERFCDHFTANGWRVGKVPMKDWRAALRNWKRTWAERKKVGPESVQSRADRMVKEAYGHG